MKTNNLKALIGLLPIMAMSACMDFDTPSDEFNGNQEVIDENVYSGKPDSLAYNVVAPEDSVDASLQALTTNFAQYLTAAYYMRGGKDGGQPGEHAYQYVYNLHIDNYAGYFCLDQNFGGKMETTYSYYREYCDGPYGQIKALRDNLANTLNHPKIDVLPEIKAVGLLMFDYTAQEMVDIYGSIPYTDLKNNRQEAPFTFEPGSYIYEKIIENIDTIDACFVAFESKPEWYKSKIEGTLVYPLDGITHDKTIKSWRRFANSLKLRMAMHYVKYNPEQARKWAEEAVAAGVVTTTDEEIALDFRTGCFTNPITVITNTWNDSKLNASLESILASLDHPYMQYVFAKNSSPITDKRTGEVLPANSRIVGLRAGTIMVSGQTAAVNPACAYSALALDDWAANKFSAMSDAPLYYIKVSEMEFLRAEGALRGWNMGGDARTFYEAGIRHAQVETRYDYPEKQYYSALVEKYMQLEEPIDYTYVDPMDSSNNHPSVTKIGVKWNDADPMEVKLEKIITQKYISLFPYGNEAWTELRRTGYPKIFPVLNAEDFSDGTYADPNEIIRRIPLPGGGSSEGDADIVNSGEDALKYDGGFGDYQYSRVFWDIDRSNF